MLELGAPEENESVTRGETLELGAPEEDEPVTHGETLELGALEENDYEENNQHETDDVVYIGVHEEMFEEVVEDTCVDMHE